MENSNSYATQSKISVFLLFHSISFLAQEEEGGGEKAKIKQYKLLKKVGKGKTWIESGKNNKNNKCIVKMLERKKYVSPVRILFVHQLSMPTSNI